MKFLILIGIGVLSVFQLAAQGPTTDEPVYRVVESMPAIGDCKELKDEASKNKCTQERIVFHIQNEIVYPEELKEYGVEGVVYTYFVVGKDGSIRDAKVIRGVEHSMDTEALRVVKMLPEFHPGKQGGKAVSVEYTIPIQFKLNHGDEVLPESED